MPARHRPWADVGDEQVNFTPEFVPFTRGLPLYDNLSNITPSVRSSPAHSS